MKCTICGGPIEPPSNSMMMKYHCDACNKKESDLLEKWPTNRTTEAGLIVQSKEVEEAVEYLKDRGIRRGTYDDDCEAFVFKGTLNLEAAEFLKEDRGGHFWRTVMRALPFGKDE